MKFKKIMVFMLFNVLALTCRTATTEAKTGDVRFDNLPAMEHEQSQISEQGTLLALNLCTSSNANTY